MDALLLTLAILAQTTDAALTCRNAARAPQHYAQAPAAVCATTISAKAAQLVPLTLMRGNVRRVWAGVLIGTGAVGVTVTLTLGR